MTSGLQCDSGVCPSRKSAKVGRAQLSVPASGRTASINRSGVQSASQTEARSEAVMVPRVHKSRYSRGVRSGRDPVAFWNVPQACANGRLSNPTKGFTATKCFSGHSGGIRLNTSESVSVETVSVGATGIG